MVGSSCRPSCRRRNNPPCAYLPVATCNRPPQAQTRGNAPQSRRNRGAPGRCQVFWGRIRPPLVGIRSTASVTSQGKNGFPWLRGSMHHACTSHVPRMHHACTWLSPPNPLPITWLIPPTYLACTWLAGGFDTQSRITHPASLPALGGLHPSSFILHHSHPGGFGVALGSH